MKPLIRVKSSYDKAKNSARALFDVYDAEASLVTTIAKGDVEIQADSTEQGELAAISAAIASIISTPFSEIEIQSDLQNIQNFVKGTSKPATHADLRNTIKGALKGKVVTANPLPEGSSATFTRVAALD